jgi:hypothetical protein
VTARVGVANEVPQLLRSAGRRSADVDEAIANRWLLRRKIEGIWLYGTTEDAIDEGEDAVAAAALNVLAGWLLGPLHPLSGYIAKNMVSPSISKNAVLVILKSMMRRGQLEGIAVFTNQYQPYLSAFIPADEDEIARQIEFVRVKAEKEGVVSATDLSEPKKERTLRAWRGYIVRHGEYIGLGYMEGGALVAWR